MKQKWKKGLTWREFDDGGTMTYCIGNPVWVCKYAGKTLTHTRKI